MTTGQKAPRSERLRLREQESVANLACAACGHRRSDHEIELAVAGCGSYDCTCYNFVLPAGLVQRRAQADNKLGRPPGNGWYIGRSGQWRRGVADWMLDREGMHAAFGVFLVALFELMRHALTPEIALGLYAITVALFIVYEVLEDWRIFDQAYRDVMGFMQGAFPAWAVEGIALIVTS